MLSNVRRAAKFIRQIRSFGENREILIVDRDTDEITEKMSNELGVGNKFIKNGQDFRIPNYSYLILYRFYNANSSFSGPSCDRVR